MKLTKTQKQDLKNYDWNIISHKTDGEEQNCSWISISPEDGSIFGEVAEELGLTGDGEDIKLLVVATMEE